MKPRFTDATYLREEQYRDGTRLQVRIELHERYSTNQYGWHRWVYDHFDLPATCDILELGCGPGHLWLENAPRIPRSWRITLSDFSPGMVRDAEHNLASTGCRFEFGVFDAEAIPVADSSFDAIIANHVLYHVPNRRKAIAEAKRALRPAGRLFAATNGRAHLRELKELVGKCWPEAQPGCQEQDWGRDAENFGLETGSDQLSPYFADIGLTRYEDALVVTDLKPLLAYVMSTCNTGTGRGDLEALRSYLERELAAEGAIRITKDSGLFKATRCDGGQPAHAADGLSSFA